MIRPPPRSTLFPYNDALPILHREGADAEHVMAAREQRRPVDRRCSRAAIDRKSTRLNSSHVEISYAVFCLKKKNKNIHTITRRHHTEHITYPDIAAI